MNKKALLIGGLLVGIGMGTAVVASSKRRTLTQRSIERQVDEWHVVTVSAPLTKVSKKGETPEPLAELGDMVELRFRRAPGEKGTEIAARIKDATDNPKESLARLRRALRDTKMLLETGEILAPDRPAHNKKTLLNRPLDRVVQRAYEEGRL